jgi:DNA adenine methylase
VGLLVVFGGPRVHAGDEGGNVQEFATQNGLEESATLGALLPYFGGKRTLAPRIVAEFGPHDGYFEPFCGSLAVLFAKERSRLENVGDLNGELVNLARVVASDRWGELLERVGRTYNAAGLYEELRAELEAVDVPPAASVDQVDDVHVRRAWSTLVVGWLGMNGMAGLARRNFNLARSYTIGGGDSATRWRGVARSLPWWHGRLAGVLIDNVDAFECLERIGDADDVVVYLDPPYTQKCAKYRHDLAPSDHARLAAAASRFKRARVVVSYYDAPDVRALYDGWTFVGCPRNKGLANGGSLRKGGRTEAPEVLILNGPSRVEAADLFSADETELPTIETELPTAGRRGGRRR